VVGGGGSGFTPDGTGLTTGGAQDGGNGSVVLSWVVEPGCAPVPPGPGPAPGPANGEGAAGTPGAAAPATPVIAVARFTG
jgi:hypothetical protein